MAGEDEFATPTPRKTVDERVAALLDELDEMQAALGLPPVRDTDDGEAARLMGLRAAELHGMTAVEAGEAATVLAGLAFHVQRKQNRWLSVAKWCDQSVRHVIAREVGNVRGYSYEERRSLAVRNDDVALKLEAVRLKAELQLTDLSYYANRIEYFARSFENLSQLKRKQHG